MKTNKISAVFLFLSLVLIVLSFMSINIYNGIKETVILRDNEIVNELKIVIGEIKDDATVESASKLKVYSQKIMNMSAYFYKDSSKLSDYSIKLSYVSSDILKNIDNDEFLASLLFEYENTLNIISGIIK